MFVQIFEFKTNIYALYDNELNSLIIQSIDRDITWDDPIEV